jgi:hypothetical protein
MAKVSDYPDRTLVRVLGIDSGDQVGLQDPADFGGGRELLTADRTYYVRTDGSDSNTGLTNTAGGAFLTIQKAVDVVTGTLDIGLAYTVTISVAAGTYAEFYAYPFVGSGVLTIHGDTTTPSNVVIVPPADTPAIFIGGSWSGSLNIGGFELNPSGSSEFNMGIWFSGANGGFAIDGDMKFGDPGANGTDIYLDGSSLLQVFGNIETLGGGFHHLYMSNGSAALYFTNITVTGTPNYSRAFAYIESGSNLYYGGGPTTGGATGKRFHIATNGAITGSGDLNVFPGDEAGTMITGGIFSPYGQRELLTADRTYYVRTDGNDANTGLANTAGGAFLTIQHAVDVVCGSLDFQTFGVTIQVADGTYAEDVFLSTTLMANVATSYAQLQGNNTNPENVIVNSIVCGYTTPAYWFASGFRVVGAGVACYLKSYLQLGVTDFHFSTGNLPAVAVGDQALLQSGGAWKITNANAATVYSYFANAYGQSQILANGMSVDFEDVIIFDTLFRVEGASVLFDLGSSSYANGGNFTGDFLDVSGGSHVTLNAETGTSVGTVDSTSSYNGVFGYPAAYREKLTADRTYYVRTDGSDSNTGLANTAGGAFLTLQHAADVVAGDIDFGGYTVTIQLGTGSFVGARFEGKTGGGFLRVHGNGSANTTITSNPIGDICLYTSIVDGFGFNNLTVLVDVYGLYLDTQSTVVIGGDLVDLFNADIAWDSTGASDPNCVAIGMYGPAFVLIAVGAHSIAGSDYYSIFDMWTQSTINDFGTWTVAGTPDFSGAFIAAIQGSVYYASGATFTGAATGQRYAGDGLSLIGTSGGGANFFPGDVAGAVTNGAVYS